MQDVQAGREASDACSSRDNSALSLARITRPARRMASCGLHSGALWCFPLAYMSSLLAKRTLAQASNAPLGTVCMAAEGCMCASRWAQEERRG